MYSRNAPDYISGPLVPHRSTCFQFSFFSIVQVSSLKYMYIKFVSYFYLLSLLIFLFSLHRLFCFLYQSNMKIFYDLTGWGVHHSSITDNQAVLRACRSQLKKCLLNLHHCTYQILLKPVYWNKKSNVNTLMKENTYIHLSL